MINLQYVCQNPQNFDVAMKNRNSNFSAQQIIDLNYQRKQQTQAIQELQAKKNSIVNNIAIAKKQQNQQQANVLSQEVKAINDEIKLLQQQNNIEQELENLLLQIPNLPEDSVPIGTSEEQNVVIETFGEIRKFNFTPLAHDEIGKNLKMLDFEQSALMSGARFSTLSGALANLERALSNFMLDIALSYDYCEVSPPNIVKKEAMLRAGQLPKFAQEAFKTEDDYWLIPTSEVSLVNLVANKILDVKQLPLRFVAYTPCFRQEAGAAGKDTKGMIRQHQFKKVELVSITTAQNSQEEHARMTKIACTVLQKLGLSFRKVLLCTGDMGFCAQKTYDLEVWLPSQNKYREISSCSNCGDFQARRANIKYKQDNNNFFAHTLNGSSLAVGRTLVAILENYQNQDGSVEVPEALQAYLQGLKKITC